MSNAGLSLALPFLDPSSMAATTSMPSLKDHTLATHPLRLGGTEKNWEPLCGSSLCHGQMGFRMKFLSSISPLRQTGLLGHHGCEVTTWHISPECSVRAGTSVTRPSLPGAESAGVSAVFGTLSANSSRAGMGSHVEGHGGFPMAGHRWPQGSGVCEAPGCLALVLRLCMTQPYMQLYSADTEPAFPRAPALPETCPHST